MAETLESAHGSESPEEFKKAPKAGKVVEIKVAAGQAVEKGQLMMVIE